MNSEIGDLADKFLEFLNQSRSAYAAVKTAKELLVKNRYRYISEKESWRGVIKHGERYFTTRNQSTIVAFAIGQRFNPDDGSGFNIVAAHTDSPCLKVKPVSRIQGAGLLQVGVECYGGGLWHTWFDRDLSISGRVLVQRGHQIVSHVISIDGPILRIPTLAIHLSKRVNADGFNFNLEQQLVPVIASEDFDMLHSTLDNPKVTHHDALLSILAKELNCRVEEILDFDLSLADAQEAVRGGAYKEFVFGGRLDNLFMSWCSLRALLEATDRDEQLVNQPQVQMVVLFDNEEIGSASAQGAASSLLSEVVQRVCDAMSHNSQQRVDTASLMRRSMLLSCDMAHAWHPNYRAEHELNHTPRMHGGVVIKQNCNHRYATSAESRCILNKLAQQHNIPVQNFVVRNDSHCGSTIGPIVSTQLGIRCIDIGIAQLSMHSIREMAGIIDLFYAVRLIKEFFLNFSTIDRSVISDDYVPTTLPA
ncbi:uncharacterized protein LOC126311197 isoform X2 [Schistocerca gregaria]|uniref:uncharacterized protein LOC126311197 isoform X2 n=1 Tax=Schistocerca gregaria TaxID=7010 RepID=UPI00211ED4C9|nr:uncharacterized protein LOC126311197 isoform X2 [Schistocerca gregaria]